MAHQGALPPIHRYITTHNSSGKAIISIAQSELAETKPLPNKEAAFTLPYTTEGFPVQLNNDADLHAYSKYLTNPPGINISNGSVARIVDMCPGHVSPMHRTVSLDYGIVIEGEVELVLDSGETRSLKPGDIAVQRSTMHAWRNVSKNWSRMVFVLLPCLPVEVGGKTLGEDYGGMEGVPKSS